MSPIDYVVYVPGARRLWAKIGPYPDAASAARNARLWRKRHVIAPLPPALACSVAPFFDSDEALFAALGAAQLPALEGQAS